VGDAARALEQKLLVYAEEFHTESGAHSKRLETWRRWARRRGLRGPKMAAVEAKRALEELVRELNVRFQADGRLPWSGGDC
jgi:hypothetical protein